MKAPKSSRGDFVLHPPGAIAAVCVHIIDTGTVFNERRQKHEHKIRLDFESSKLMEDGNPFLISNFANFSMFQNSHLRGFIEAWLGKGFADQDQADNFDFNSLLGKPAFLNITHSPDGKYANIGTVMPLPEGMTAPTPRGKTLLFDLDNPNREVFDQLSKKTQERIMQSEEWKALRQSKKPEPEPEPEFDDDIPW